VRLKEPVRTGRQKAQIISEHDEFSPGAVRLNHYLGDSRWWNKAHLVATTAPAWAKKPKP
jgi:hypothetical protein